MKGVTVVLVLVSVAALAVAFSSSAKARSVGTQTAALRAEVNQLRQATQALGQNLREAQEMYEKEQVKSQALAEELEQLKAKASENAKAPASKTR